MGANSTKLTKEFNYCKGHCWSKISNRIRDGLTQPKYNKDGTINNNSYLYKLENEKKILTIGCPNCDLECSGCMYIEIQYIRNRYNVGIFTDSSKKRQIGGMGNIETSRQVFNFIEKVYQQVK